MPKWHNQRQNVENQPSFTTLLETNTLFLKDMILDIPGRAERRQSPRFVVKQSADIMLDNGNSFNVETRNISTSGLQIICNSWVTEEIEPRGIQSHTISHLRFKIIMALKIGNETKKIYTNCRVMSAQRLSQDEYRLNIAFLSFENGSDSVLNAFLEQFMQKKTMISASA